MKTAACLLSVTLISCASFGAETADCRERTFVDPVRVVWKSQPSAEYSAECAVKHEERLLLPRRGQVPEAGWTGAKAQAGGCFMENCGNVASIILDFGRELHGGIVLGVGAASSRGMKARVRFGESVSETCSDAASGERGAGNDHAIRDGVIDLPFMGLREIGETGFRFVRIDLVTTGHVTLESVRAVSVMRSMRRVGSFRCSDERLNRIWDTAARTAHLCCQRYLWDGIKRDRMVWMGDTYPMTMAILNVFGAAPVLPDSLDYMADVTDPEKEWMNNFPSWTLWWVRNLAEWYRYTGQREYLDKYIGYVEKVVGHLASVVSPTNTFDMSPGFLDWPTQHNQPAVRAGMQALAGLTFRDAEFLGREAGRKDFADSCRRLAERVDSVAVDPHGSKQVAALLTLSGRADAGEMFWQVLGRNGCAGVSTFYGYFMLEAMSRAGEDAHALKTVRDYWGGMLDVGATSFWENFDLAWTNGCSRIDEMPVAGKKDIHGDYGEFCYPGFRHSLCHGWASGPAAWLINHVLGIRPVSVGCRRVEVKPFLGDLGWAEGAMALPDGRAVHVRVERRADGSVRTVVDAPEDVTVEGDGIERPDVLPMAARWREPDLSRVRVGGELLTRLNRNFGRLEEEKYRPDRVFLTMKESWDWPGDTEGRTILGLMLDAQATDRRPKHLDAILARLPEKLNEKGYMGPVFDKLHEQQLSGNGWLLRGLCEHYRGTGSRESLTRARRLLEGLFLADTAPYAEYPTDPACRAKGRGGASGNIDGILGRWMLSTDIGCVFIAMDAMIEAYEFFPKPRLKDAIDALLARFLTIEPMAIQAQAHATLTALRGLIKYGEMTGESRWIAEAERGFRIYCEHCMTENYENYNWYERFDRLSESCAVVDSFMVALALGRDTGRSAYFDLAHRIYWNGLCRLQRRNGGFGLDVGPGKGAGTPDLSVGEPEAHWCCTMRGAEGLAQAAQNACLVRGDDVLIVFPREGHYDLKVRSGRFPLKVTGDFPLGKTVRLEIDGDVPADSELLLFVPAHVKFAGRTPERDGFIRLGKGFSRGQAIELAYELEEHELALQNPANALSGFAHRKFRGPLQLGADAQGKLRPLYHLMDESVWEKGSGKLRILFP